MNSVKLTKKDYLKKIILKVAISILWKVESTRWYKQEPKLFYCLDKKNIDENAKIFDYVIVLIDHN